METVFAAHVYLFGTTILFDMKALTKTKVSFVTMWDAFSKIVVKGVQNGHTHLLLISA